MIMRLLIVEDNEDFVRTLVEIMKQLDPEVTYIVEDSKQSALARIDAEFFDLIVLDLNIPTISGAPDGDRAHGYAVFADARVAAPGTPLIVLTGSPAEEYFPSLLKESNNSDIWGGQVRLPVVAFHQKHKLDSFPHVLEAYVKQLIELKGIEINRNGVLLSDAEERLVRIFARQSDSTKVSLSQITSGFSGARVLRLRVTNANGVLIHDTVCKIGDQKDIQDEDQKYQKYVSRLPPEATPRKLATLEYGGKKTSAVFYGLAKDFSLSANNFLDDNKSPNNVIKRLEQLLFQWITTGESRKMVGEIRCRLLNDEKYRDLARCPAWSNNLEKQEIQVKWGIAHGDLHTLNILISEHGFPILIDYGDVGEGPSSLDPVTLELCLFFHPQGVLRGSEWPTIIQAKKWGDLDAYLAGCPYPEFIRACREWALRIAAGEREVAAVAYSYLIRQLKYPETDAVRAAALLEGTKAYYDQT